MCNKGVAKGYNQLHVTPVYDVLNKTYIHCVIQPQPKQDEVGALKFILDWYGVKKKTLIVVDRGFESYNLLAHFKEKQIDYLIRVKQEYLRLLLLSCRAEKNYHGWILKRY